jgi:hypothetical protein
MEQEMAKPRSYDEYKEIIATSTRRKELWFVFA